MRILDNDTPHRDDVAKAETLQSEPYRTMQEKEQFILTVSSDGYGQLASSYDYRVTGRGGKGIQNMDIRKKNATVTGSFHIDPDKDEIILVTDGGAELFVSLHIPFVLLPEIPKGYGCLMWMIMWYLLPHLSDLGGFGGRI